MAVKRMKSDMDVVQATRLRIKNVFANGVTVYLSFSGGKDSIVLADITMKLIKEGQINPRQLVIIFIDEEAIYTSVEQTVIQWREKFLSVGAAFQWWCVEVKHFSAYNQLTADESYTCWDHTKQNAWVRQPPPYALRNHPQLRPGIDNYQSFLPKITGDGIQMIGVRASESVQRLQYMARLNLGTGVSITGKNFIYPIYDWKTRDVWMYLYREKVDIPIIYLWMYQAGVSKGQMRICQYFSVDCVGSLIHIAEYEPGLWEKILKREPNAYLAALYWDTELYRRSSSSRRSQEKERPREYKALVMRMLFEEPDKHFTTDLTRKVANSYRKLIIKMDSIMSEREWRKVYNALTAGDPKLRTHRAIAMDIASAYAEYSKGFRTKAGGALHA